MEYKQLDQMEKYHIKENSVYSNKVLKEENMLEKKWIKNMIHYKILISKYF